MPHSWRRSPPPSASMAVRVLPAPTISQMMYAKSLPPSCSTVVMVPNEPATLRVISWMMAPACSLVDISSGTAPIAAADTAPIAAAESSSSLRSGPSPAGRLTRRREGGDQLLYVLLLDDHHHLVHHLHHHLLLLHRLHHHHHLVHLLLRRLPRCPLRTPQLEPSH